MISLRQTELAAWQEEIFGDTTSERMCLGMQEELGELAHCLLKRKQRIREGTHSDLKEKIADAVADVMIFGIQLLHVEGLDAELVFSEVAEKILKRTRTELEESK